MQPEIGKLYNVIHYETMDEFFRQDGVDAHGQNVYRPLTSAEKAELAQQVLMLVSEKPYIHCGKKLVIWNFLAGDKTYITTPCNRHVFGETFRKASIHDKHTPTWQTL